MFEFDGMLPRPRICGLSHESKTDSCVRRNNVRPRLFERTRKNRGVGLARTLRTEGNRRARRCVAVRRELLQIVDGREDRQFLGRDVAARLLIAICSASSASASESSPRSSISRVAGVMSRALVGDLLRCAWASHDSTSALDRGLLFALRAFEHLAQDVDDFVALDLARTRARQLSDR